MLPIDRAMARLVEWQAGEPRVLRARDRVARVRLYGCRGCASPEEGGCQREREQVRDAFKESHGGADGVSETRCRGRGDPYCEFEVRHP
jgi:predicted hydrocarbon binding protein